MKVNKKMIAKDLRFCGSIYKLLLSKPTKKNSRKEKEVKMRNTDSSKYKYNVYLDRDDGTKLRVLIKKPKESTDIGVLWLHGGGYVTGIPEMVYLSMVNKISDKVIIISPEYRLAKVSPYPAALNDCYLTLKWMVENASNLGIRDDKIFVGGESAGGGLCVALCLLARDKKEISIACQIPLYPMLNNIKTASMINNNAPVWNEKQNEVAWDLYLRGLNEIPKYAVPLKETDYSNLPPIITFVGTIEPFYD